MMKARIASVVAGALFTAAALTSGPALAQQKLVLKASDVHPAGYPTVVAVEGTAAVRLASPTVRYRTISRRICSPSRGVMNSLTA